MSQMNTRQSTSFYGILCLLPNGRAQECLLDENLVCEQMILDWYRKLRDIPLYSVKARYKMASPCYLLHADLNLQGLENWEPRSSCWDPEVRSCHSKRAGSSASDYKQEFVLLLLVIHWLTLTWMTWHYWRSTWHQDIAGLRSNPAVSFSISYLFSLSFIFSFFVVAIVLPVMFINRNYQISQLYLQLEY